MTIEYFREYCLSKKAVTEEFPFGDVTMVMKVAGKMFALASIDGNYYINLKCDPELALELRERYPAVQEGYHMSKKHWNSIYIDGSISVKQISEWIDHSYQLVFDALPKKVKQEISETI